MLRRLAILALVTFATIRVLEGQGTPLSPPKQGVVAEQKSSAKGQEQPQNKNSNQAAPDPPTASPQPAHPTCDEACQQSRENLQIQHRLATFTLLLVVVGTLQVGSMIWQAWLLRETRSDIHTQAGFMSDQTNILRDSVAAAEKSAEAAERSAIAAIGMSAPILVLHKLSLNHFPELEPSAFFEHPDFRIEVKNFGQSPAFLKAYTIDVAAGELPDEPIYSEQWEVDMQEVVDAGAVYILGGEEGRCTTNRNLSAEAVQKLATGRESLIVYGTIIYGDVFGSPLRTMKFSKIFWELVNHWSGEWFKEPLMADWGGPRYTGQSEGQNPNQEVRVPPPPPPSRRVPAN